MTTNADYLECRDCACLNARMEAQRLTRAFDERLRPFGLTINQFSTLTTLILAGPSPVARLARLLGIDRTTLSRNIALGERKGLVSVHSGKDAREKLIEITPLGRQLADSALPAWRSAQEAARNERL